jgi:pimeloyl-ACP methyl ester carboxylesterase
MRRFALVLSLAAFGCNGDEPPGTTVAMQFDAGGESAFFDAPFPSDHRRVEGRVVVAGHPSTGSPLSRQIVDLLDEQADGFATTAAVFLRTSGPIDTASLSSLEESVGPGASVVLVAIDPEAPGYLQPHPVEVAFHDDGGPHGAPNLLSVLPLQGLPLAPRTTYAAIVTSNVRAADGRPLARAPALDQIAAGQAPSGLSIEALASYQRALEASARLGLDARGIAAFTTWDPTKETYALVAAAQSLPTPEPVAPLSRGEVFDDFCVYEGEIDMPVYQAGEPPFADGGGAIAFEDGVPVLVTHERARLVITIPRRPMPAAGFPVATMIRTGGGGDRPLVDRGPRAIPGGEAVTPGTGPALHFARAGFAGLSIDGPHGGIRNVTRGDEQFLMFNVGNAAALRDNLRQSALEIALLPALLDAASIEVSDCPDVTAPADVAVFDTDRLALMGHSMGATIAPLTLATEPRFGATILSGAGGSYIENVIHKESPLPVRPLVELLIRYAAQGVELQEHDPFLSLLQWAGEPSDPPVYGAAIAAQGTHVLMLQGIVDTYILPPIANATSLSHGLDLAGEALDATHPELAPRFRPLEALLGFSGRTTVALPATGNRDGVTAVVVQHPEDGIEDGHEVVFQTEAPQRQYECFLASFAEGVPRVPAPADPASPCF